MLFKSRCNATPLQIPNTFYCREMQYLERGFYVTPRKVKLQKRNNIVQ